MSINDLIEAVDEKLTSLNKDGIVGLWNIVFPEEERISLSDLFSDTVVGDMKEMLQEEIAMADTKKILKAYNMLTGDELTIEDMDSDEEGWESQKEEEEEEE